jgi:6,7-dimethyl-8-ribityllumazine synthase
MSEKDMNIIDINNTLEPSWPIAIVVSKFNQEITQGLLEGALARLDELGYDKQNLSIIHVPGAVEIPLAAQSVVRHTEVKAVIALGAVIRGETTHYDYVCDYVTKGCLEVSLAHNIPVVFGVLTTENGQQARDRIGGAHGHKGKEAVDTAVSMINTQRQISNT